MEKGRKRMREETEECLRVDVSSSNISRHRPELSSILVSRSLTVLTESQSEQQTFDLQMLHSGRKQLSMNSRELGCRI
jgi:hypothetical protein